MKNVHLLPTDRPSRLIKFKDETNLLLSSLPSIKGQGFNIYITNDEEIKENDYVIVSCSEVNIEEVRIVTGYYNEQFLFDDKSQIHMDYCKKIILTTDGDLINDGVQAIDDEFLEWFVKNTSCERVEVKELLSNNGNAFYGYKIIIPKEEPKQIKCYCGHTITCDCEPLQETLEEAKQRILDSNYLSLNDADIFKMGAEWQRKQILDFLYSEITERRDYSASKMCEKVVEFIEQF